MEENKNTPETFLLFNELVGTIEAINLQYNNKTKSMCNVVVFGCLAKAYSIHEVYERLLCYMQENDLYERYLPCILELQFNPPPSNLVQEIEQNKKGNNEETKAEKGGGIKTKKIEENKDITKIFIDNLFKDEEE